MIGCGRRLAEPGPYSMLEGRAPTMIDYAPSALAAEMVPQPAPAPEPAPEPVAVVLTPADPNRPKRAGWWSRTKAALGGE